MASSEGYLMIDHRASPGIPAEQAQRMGLDPQLLGEGKLFEAATMTCAHCGTVVIRNPGRTRERAHCFQCNAYICDGCEFRRTHDTDYVHLPLKKVTDLVHDGRHAWTGTDVTPILKIGDH